MRRYDAIGFDLLTALLDTRSLWAAIAGDGERGKQWQEYAQALLRGRPYRPYEDIVREAAVAVGLQHPHAETLFQRWSELSPWPDVGPTLDGLRGYRLFIVTNCSERLGTLAASRAGSFELVMTAERAGAYKPDPRPYRAALDALDLDATRVLFVAGSAHDVGGAGRVGMDVYWANRHHAARPADGMALREAADLGALAEVVEISASGPSGVDLGRRRSS
jgi:2-haloacid dehalogenase